MDRFRFRFRTARRAALGVVAAVGVVLTAAPPAAFAAPPAGLRIVSPDPGQTVHDNDGTVAVVVTGADPGAPLRPVIDGKPSDRTYPAPAFELHGVPRGSHEIVVHLLDAQGRPLAATPPVRFHVFQASRLF